MLFKTKDRLDALKTPMVHKIRLPDSDTPPPIRRSSTTTTSGTTTTITTTEEPFERRQTRGWSVSNRVASFMTQSHGTTQRGAPSHALYRVSTVPMKTHDGKAPPQSKDKPGLPRASVMTRKWSESGGRSSQAYPKKTVNFALDVHEAKHRDSGYTTEAGSSTGWSRPTRHSDRDQRRQEPTKIEETPCRATRREIHLSESPSSTEEPIAVWTSSLRSDASAPPAMKHHRLSRRLDGYATESDTQTRFSGMRTNHARGDQWGRQRESRRPVAETTSSKIEPEISPMDILMKASFQVSNLPPGLHPKLLADVTGMPPLRFNIIFPPSEPYLKTWDHIPRAFDDAILQEAATEPELKAMAILLYCQPLAPWEVIVRRHGAIRCQDIFDAVWREYDVPLTDIEKAKIPEPYMSFFQKGFKQRCKQVPVLTALEESRGLKRVDLLGGMTYFRGMTKPHLDGPWVVELQPPPSGYSL